MAAQLAAESATATAEDAVTSVVAAEAEAARSESEAKGSRGAELAAAEALQARMRERAEETSNGA